MQRRRVTVLILWLLGLHAVWTLAWIVHGRDAWGPWLDDGYWLAAKLIVWIAPILGIALAVEKRSILEHLDLDRSSGIWRGLLVATLWIAGSALVDHFVRGAMPSTDIGLGTASACLVAPLFEEALFRGHMLRTLRDLGVGFWIANALAAIAFAVLHFPGWWFQGRPALEIASGGAHFAVLGFIFGAVRGPRGSLWPSIALHGANNAWSSGLVLAPFT